MGPKTPHTHACVSLPCYRVRLSPPECTLNCVQDRSQVVRCCTLLETGTITIHVMIMTSVHQDVFQYNVALRDPEPNRFKQCGSVRYRFTYPISLRLQPSVSAISFLSSTTSPRDGTKKRRPKCVTFNSLVLRRQNLKFYACKRSIFTKSRFRQDNVVLMACL